MKKILLILFAFILVSPLCFSADTKDVFHTNQIVWCGLDFSKAKMVGPGFNDPDAIVTEFLKSWNDLILKESKKYNIKEATQKDNIIYDISAVTERNQKIDKSKILSENSYQITKADVEAAIAEYKLDSNTGIGLVFVVEAFDGIEKEGRMWVTFFDIATKKVLLSEKMSGKSGGFGFRNNWAKSYFLVIRELKDKFSDWKNEYNR